MPFDSRRGARIRTGDPLLPKQSRKHANHGKKPSNSLMDCTICRSCRFDARHPAGVQQRENSGNCRKYCGSLVNAKAPATEVARAEGALYEMGRQQDTGVRVHAPRIDQTGDIHVNCYLQVRQSTK